MKKFILALVIPVFFISCQKVPKSKEDFIVSFLENIEFEEKIILLNQCDSNWGLNFEKNYENLEYILLYQRELNTNKENIEKYDQIINSFNWSQTLSNLQCELSLKAIEVPGKIELIDQDEISKKSKLELSYFNYYVISSPAFSRNNKFGIIYFAQHCGIECGGGDLIIMKWENGKWEKFLVLPLWIS